MENTILLQQVKGEWQQAIHLGNYLGFEQFLRDNFTPIYDEKLDFIGYARSPVYSQS